MSKLVIEETPKTPEIIFDPEEGTLSMKGRSIPENSLAFYEPIFAAIDAYTSSPKPLTKVLLYFEYFSTSSSKCILDIFKKFEGIHKAGHEVNITWYYEDRDENMRDAGVDYEAIVYVPFSIEQFKE